MCRAVDEMFHNQILVIRNNPTNVGTVHLVAGVLVVVHGNNPTNVGTVKEPAQWRPRQVEEQPHKRGDGDRRVPDAPISS